MARTTPNVRADFNRGGVVPGKNIIARAFELAPECSNGKQLRKKLRQEGYDSVESHLGGLGTRRELRKLYNQETGRRER